MEILNYKPIAKGCIKASFDLKDPEWDGSVLRGFVIRGMLEMEKGESHWISFPSHKFEVDGEQRYKYHCLFEDTDQNREFLDKVKDCLKNGAADSMVQSNMPF